MESFSLNRESIKKAKEENDFFKDISVLIQDKVKIQIKNLRIFDWYCITDYKRWLIFTDLKTNDSSFIYQNDYSWGFFGMYLEWTSVVESSKIWSEKYHKINSYSNLKPRERKKILEEDFEEKINRILEKIILWPVKDSELKEVLFLNNFFDNPEFKKIVSGNDFVLSWKSYLYGK